MEHWNDSLKNLHLALRLVGWNFKHEHLELVWEVQKAYEKKGDSLTLRELTAIEVAVKEKYAAPKEPQTI